MHCVNKRVPSITHNLACVSWYALYCCCLLSCFLCLCVVQPVSNSDNPWYICDFSTVAFSCRPQLRPFTPNNIHRKRFTISLFSRPENIISFVVILIPWKENHSLLTHTQGKKDILIFIQLSPVKRTKELPANNQRTKNNRITDCF